MADKADSLQIKTDHLSTVDRAQGRESPPVKDRHPNY